MTYWNRVKRVVAATVRRARHYGVLPALRSLLNRCWRMQSLLLYEAASSALASEPMVDVTVQRMSLADLRPHADALLREGLGIVPAEEMSGRHCYVAIRDGEIIGIGWRYATGVLLNVVAPNDTAVYLGGFVVSQKARGGGIYPGMLAFMGRDGLPGHTRVLVEVDAENTASRRGLVKAGFSCRGELRLVSVIGIVVNHKLIPADEVLA